MLTDYFIYDGISSRDLGIQQQGNFLFSAPEPVFTEEQVPGRNGALKFWDGSYKNTVGSVSCYTLDKNAGVVMAQINRWLTLSPGYHRLEVSTDPEYYRLAMVSMPPELDIRNGILAPFTLTFSCKPQRFHKLGEAEIEITAPGTLYNHGFPSKPLITVYGSGAGTLTINGIVVSFKSISSYVTLDCDIQNAYKGTENKNATISAPEFPTLETGENAISWSGGVTKIAITPRWWTL